MKGDGVYDDAITDKVEAMLVEDTRRNSVQDNLITVDVKGVAGIRTSLKTGNHIVAGSKVVYYLSLSFVAPLQAEQNIYHWISLKARKIIKLFGISVGQFEPGGKLKE